MANIWGIALLGLALPVLAPVGASPQSVSQAFEVDDADLTGAGLPPLPLGALSRPPAPYPDAIEYSPPTPPDAPPDPTITDAFKASQVTEQFETLRGYRNRLVDTVRTLTSQIQGENEQLKILQPNRRQLQDALRFQTDSLPPRQTLITQETRIKDHLEALKAQAKSNPARNENPARKNGVATDTPPAGFTYNEQQLYQSQLDYLEELINNYDSKDGQLKQRKTELQQHVQSASALITKVTDLVSKNTQTLNSLNSQLSDADEKIANLFGKSDARNAFKKTMSAAFAGLVAIVIIGFFYVASKDESVRRSIFTNESGIQFITLFSLVIAIILFGIVEVLEGKELAALLGGLSGYILGRGTAKPASG